MKKKEANIISKSNPFYLIIALVFFVLAVISVFYGSASSFWTGDLVLSSYLILVSTSLFGAATMLFMVGCFYLFTSKNKKQYWLMIIVGLILFIISNILPVVF